MLPYKAVTIFLLALTSLPFEGKSEEICRKMLSSEVGTFAPARPKTGHLPYEAHSSQPHLNRHSPSDQGRLSSLGDSLSAPSSNNYDSHFRLAESYQTHKKMLVHAQFSPRARQYLKRRDISESSFLAAIVSLPLHQISDISKDITTDLLELRAYLSYQGESYTIGVLYSLHTRVPKITFIRKQKFQSPVDNSPQVDHLFDPHLIASSEFLKALTRSNLGYREVHQAINQAAEDSALETVLQTGPLRIKIDQRDYVISLFQVEVGQPRYVLDDIQAVPPTTLLRPTPPLGDSIRPSEHRSLPDHLSAPALLAEDAALIDAKKGLTVSHRTLEFVMRIFTKIGYEFTKSEVLKWLDQLDNNREFPRPPRHWEGDTYWSFSKGEQFIEVFLSQISIGAEFWLVKSYQSTANQIIRVYANNLDGRKALFRFLARFRRLKDLKLPGSIRVASNVLIKLHRKHNLEETTITKLLNRQAFIERLMHKPHFTVDLDHNGYTYRIGVAWDSSTYHIKTVFRTKRSSRQSHLLLEQSEFIYFPIPKIPA